jgi:hypothetical protein
MPPGVYGVGEDPVGSQAARRPDAEEDHVMVLPVSVNP